jgi:hypothetical protein
MKIKTTKQSETDILFKQLTILNGVTSTRWEMVMLLADKISKKEVLVDESSWDDKFKNENPEIYKLDLSIRHTWSTYDNCINLYFYAYANSEAKQLKCLAKIYDGIGTSDCIGDLRFSATLSLPLEFISFLTSEINSAFNKVLENAYTNYLEGQQQIWMENYKKEILNTK